MTQDEAAILNAQQSSMNGAVRSVINNYTFIDYGYIKEIVSEDVVTVQSVVLEGSEAEEPRLYTEVELLRLGTRDVRLTIAPKEGDNVLLLASKHYYEKVVVDVEPQVQLPAPPYNPICMKAILIAPSETDGEFLDIEILPEDKKITLKDVTNTNTVTFDDEAILIDANGTKATLNNNGDIELAAGSATATLAKDGDVILKAGNTTATLANNGDIELAAGSATATLAKDGDVILKAGNTTATLANNGAITLQGAAGKLEVA